MMEKLLREPAAITGLVQVIITLMVLFGVPVTTEQAAAILSVTTMALAMLTRALVTPNAAAEEQAQDAADTARGEAIVARAMSPSMTLEQEALTDDLRWLVNRLSEERRST
jgi:TRAP-type C4-dicarboxylate transport system permease large subunit